MNPIIDTLQAWSARPPGVSLTRHTVAFEVSKVLQRDPDGSDARVIHEDVTCLLHRDFFVVGEVKVPSPKGTILEVMSRLGKPLMMLGSIEHVSIRGDGCVALRTRDLPEYVVHTTVPADDGSYHDLLAEA